MRTPLFRKLAQLAPVYSLAPAPLPSLPDALSRRAALFGAVTVSGMLTGSAARALSDPAPILPGPSDARLHMLADVMERAQRVGKAAEAVSGDECHSSPEWQEAVDCFLDAAILMRDTAAATSEGVTAKARAFRLHWLASDADTAADIGLSLAADVLRLSGGAA